MTIKKMWQMKLNIIKLYSDVSSFRIKDPIANSFHNDLNWLNIRSWASNRQWYLFMTTIHSSQNLLISSPSRFISWLQLLDEPQMIFLTKLSQTTVYFLVVPTPTNGLASTREVSVHVNNRFFPKLYKVVNVANKSIHREKQNKFRQKIAPRGIEPRTSWSLL